MSCRNRLLLAAVVLVALGSPLFPVEPNPDFSLYASIVTPYLPPVDQGLVTSRVQATASLAVIDNRLSGWETTVEWNGVRTLFYLYSRPLVSTLSLRLARWSWSIWQISLAPAVGASLVVDRGSGATGLSVDAGVNAVWVPLSFLKIGSPLLFNLYQDGFGIDWRVVARPLIPAARVGFDISLNMLAAGRYDFSAFGAEVLLGIGLGAGSRYE